MKDKNVYNCIIVGGGLAGLSLAILLRQKNYSVLLIEKKSYPYHKVCGEFISMESFDFLIRLGIPIDSMDLPRISKFQMTATKGTTINESLQLGGFGISRFTLDNLLAIRAKELGVELFENTTCNSFNKHVDFYEVETNIAKFQTRILCASFGRHAFGNFYKPLQHKPENWIGVKYHIKHNFPSDTIALHTFEHGYCGISKIENHAYCLCYLVKASSLKAHSNSIQEMERSVLFKNSSLKKIFQEAEFIFEKPLTISNVTFDVKRPTDDDIFYLGDSAGTIAPLTGNGMSNAMRSAWLLHNELDAYYKQEISFAKLVSNYKQQWRLNFKQRIWKGRWIQYFFCKPMLTSFFMGIMKQSTWLRKMIIRQTHGERF